MLLTTLCVFFKCSLIMTGPQPSFFKSKPQPTSSSLAKTSCSVKAALSLNAKSYHSKFAVEIGSCLCPWSTTLYQLQQKPLSVDFTLFTWALWSIREGTFLKLAAKHNISFKARENSCKYFYYMTFRPGDLCLLRVYIQASLTDLCTWTDH